MRNIWTIARREYNLILVNPVAYIVGVLILLILGLIFYASLAGASIQGYVPNIQTVISPLITIFLFATPALTMRTLAEEQKSGTLEILLTAPVTDVELIIGKWLGSLFFVLTILLVTWIYPFILNQLVSPGIDQGILVTMYLGLVLMMSAMLAIGIFVSSLFSNQIAAFFATLGILLLLWLISYPSQAMMNTGGNILQYLDMSEHYYNTFYAGLIDLKDIIYYLSVTALGLFLGIVSVQTRRWR